MDALDYWRRVDELSVVQAALLIVDEDPSGTQHERGPGNRPKGYDAAKHREEEDIMTISRRSVLSGALAAPAIAASTRLGSAAPAQTLKVSHQFPGGTFDEGAFRDGLCRKFAAELEKRRRPWPTIRKSPTSMARRAPRCSISTRRRLKSGARSPATPRGRTTRRRRRCPRSSSSSPKVSRCPDVRRDIAMAHGLDLVETEQVAAPAASAPAEGRTLTSGALS